MNESKILKMFRINAKNIASDKTKPLNIELSLGNDKSKLLSQAIRNKKIPFQITSNLKMVKIFHIHTFKESVIKITET